MQTEEMKLHYEKIMEKENEMPPRKLKKLVPSFSEKLAAKARQRNLDKIKTRATT